jgi:hypothetical protein
MLLRVSDENSGTKPLIAVVFVGGDGGDKRMTSRSFHASDDRISRAGDLGAAPLALSEHWPEYLMESRGLTAIAIVYSRWGKRSCAHIHPAFTLTFGAVRRVETWDAFFYAPAQFAGDWRVSRSRRFCWATSCARRMYGPSPIARACSHFSERVQSD